MSPRAPQPAPGWREARVGGQSWFHRGGCLPAPALMASTVLHRLSTLEPRPSDLDLDLPQGTMCLSGTYEVQLRF